MDQSPESQQCTNCHKFFPIDRIDLHEAYCCRNIRKCKQCEKLIDVKDIEQHDKQFHEKVECSMCQQMIDPQEMLSHQDKCDRKPMHCKYCENTWPLIEYDRHVQSCGARTKPCTVCHKNIMLKDFDDHAGRCERRRQERAEVSQDQMRERVQRRVSRGGGERQRQNSTNNIRDSNKPTSVNKIIKPTSFKPSNIIGPEIIKAAIDPIPISVRLAMKNRERDQPRAPLKSKN